MSRVIIRVKAKNLIDVINSLSVDDEFFNNADYTIEVGIKETKENFQYLINSDKIIDWSFVEDESTESATENNLIENKKPVFDNPELQEIYEYFLDESNFDKSCSSTFRLAYLLNLVYTIKIKSPLLRFTIGNLKMIKDKTEYFPLMNTAELLLSARYRNFEYSTSLEDFISRINKNWKNLDNGVEDISNYSVLITNILLV